MKRLLALLFALALGTQWTYAYNFSQTIGGQTFYFNITNATGYHVEVTYPGSSSSNPWNGYTMPTGTVQVPQGVTHDGNTYIVTGIGQYAFKGCTGITSVTISNTLLTSIGERAFYGCSGLTSVTLPNSITTIGTSAFYGCSGLASVNIPTSATSIGGWAFYNTNLSSVTIPG
ncbi:MAG: leucine-rich repeat domain-containing protein, partial [Bacteroidales bacterium]|nr:leucine-rich repeat domain-containing protein [Bacteroidales bacterium]